MPLQPRLSRHSLERVLLGALAVLLVAAVCADDPYEQDDTLQQAGAIRPGETQGHRLCDPDWAAFPVQHDSVYAIETRNLAGGADTLMELWECAPTSDFGCRYQRAVLSDDDGRQAGGSRIVRQFSTRLLYRFEPAPRPSTAWAAITQKGPVGDSDPSYDLSLTCLSACEDLGTVAVLPTVATRAGLVTDLMLANPGYLARDVELVLSPTLTEPPAPRMRQLVTVPGGATVRYEDVVSSLFGLSDAGGALEIRPIGGDVVTQAVLRDPRSSSSRGEVVAPVPLSESAPRGQTFHHLLLGTRDGASARLAICEPTGGPAEALVRVHAADGTLLRAQALALPPHGQIEIDLQADLGVSPAPDLSASVQIARGHLLTASVVADRESGDVFVQKGVVPSTSPTLLATRSGTYRTELAIRSLGESTAAAWFDVGAVRVALGTHELAANATWYLPDPLAEVAEGSDGLITVPAGLLVASARVLSRDADGSSGSSAPTFGPFGYPGTSRRVSLLVPPGISTVTLAASGTSGFCSLLDDRGKPLESSTYQGNLSWIAPVDSPLLERDPSSSPSRLEVEVASDSEPYTFYYDAPRAFAILLSPGSHDVAVVRGEPIGRAFETLALSIPTPQGDVPLVLRRIPPGKFVMGSPETERGRDGDETPHSVEIRQPFLMGETEVSLRHWEAITGRIPPDLPPAYSGVSRGSLPVVNVSWDEVAGAGGFLERLTAAQAGRGVSGTFRLPSEAEWEHAARAVTTSAFGSLGDLDDCDRSCGPCDFDPPIRYCRTSGDAGPRVVGFGPENAFGLRETSGNAWEWVADRYGPYEDAPQVDPAGPAEGETRVLRGGGWRSELRLCRSANRFGYPPAERYDQVGFRIAFSIGGR